MIFSFLYSLPAAALLSLGPAPEPEAVITDTLSESVLVTSYKQVLPMERIASPVSEIGMAELDSRGISDIKKLSSVVPNLHIPDYGSSMTSSIYLRGFGSRIDNPVVGMYVDDIPVMNKNAYDMELADISSAVLLRGPQSTLYGRNSMCGVLSLETFSPENFHGNRLAVEYGNANTVLARLSLYGSSGIGFSAAYRHTDGFYLNTYNGEYADKSDALNLRMRVWKQLRKDLVFENILSASLTDQGGYPYREYDTAAGELAPLAYDDPCGYRRLSVTEGLKFKYMNENWTLSSVTSLQFLADEMQMDQDFTVRSMFTLKQAQLEGALTQELILKPEASWRKSWWNWQTGFFAFAKYNDMSAPVRFKHDGIQDLILANANSGLQSVFGDAAAFMLQEDEFDISSDFGITTAGAALYHESYFTLGRWTLTAGLRLDYEWAGMDYDSRALVHYNIKLPFMTTGFVPCESVYKGWENNSYLEVMPKISALYDLGSVKLFATFSEGYKSGGFNTQIFSDILQNRLMSAMMEKSPVRLPESGIGADDTVYKPEKSMNAEMGTRFSFSSGRHSFSGTASVYAIMCVDQQITVFPSGQTTGRMMTNAGKTRSIGGEVAVAVNLNGFEAGVSYGYTNAKFTEYDNGITDYRDNYVPYIPANTLSAYAGYSWYNIGGLLDKLSVMANYTGTGKIYWNEENTMSQPFYSLLGASLKLEKGWAALEFWAKNLTDTKYNLFYFVSVGNAFYAQGRPAQYGINLYFNF